MYGFILKKKITKKYITRIANINEKMLTKAQKMKYIMLQDKLLKSIDHAAKIKYLHVECGGSQNFTSSNFDSLIMHNEIQIHTFCLLKYTNSSFLTINFERRKRSKQKQRGVTRFTVHAFTVFFITYAGTPTEQLPTCWEKKLILGVV